MTTIRENMISLVTQIRQATVENPVTPSEIADYLENFFEYTNIEAGALFKARENHTGAQPISTVTGLQVAIDSKVDKVAGKGLSTNDFEDAYKNSLDSLDFKFGAKQNQLNGKGFVKSNGTIISYDNSAYLTGITSLNVTTALGFTPYNATNPAGYISSVPAQSFASLTGKPTTLSGYSIVDAYPLTGNPSGYVASSRTLTINGTTFDLSANRSWTISAGGSSAWADITGKPTTLSGYGITDSVQQTALNLKADLSSPIFTGTFTSNSTKHLFGTQTDDGTFAQFVGAVKVKNNLTVNGSLVIGTTTPSSILSVVSGVTNTATRGITNDQISDDSTSASLAYRKSRGIIGAQTTVLTQDLIGNQSFRAFDGSSYLVLAGIGAVVNGTVSAGIIPTDLFFYAGSSSVGNSYDASRMVLTSNGYIGIGTKTPTSTFHNTGSVAQKFTTITGATTLDATHYYVNCMGTTSYQIDIPAASTCPGRVYILKIRQSSKTTGFTYINNNGGVVNGFTQGLTYTLVSDGTDWQQL